MEIILDDEGIQLGMKDAHYYLIYDEGELAVRMRELLITDEEAKSIMEDPSLIDKIILKYQNAELFLK